MESIPEQIVRVARIMFERRLTDVAGGNLSARHGDHLYITPTRAGQDKLWELTPADLLHCRIDSDELIRDPHHSKESISHLSVYRAFPEVGGIIHAHPFHLMPFLAAEKSPSPLILSARAFGELEYIPDLPLYSLEQGEAFVEKFLLQRERLSKMGAALLMPRHGIFIAAPTLLACLDCLERIDDSAWTNLAARLLE